jgi:hypothetical protein
MAKKTIPKATPSEVVTPPAAVLPVESDTTYGTDRTYKTDPAEATPPSVEPQVLAKMQAGLTRPQALEVLEQQRAHDKKIDL